MSRKQTHIRCNAVFDSRHTPVTSEAPSLGCESYPLIVSAYWRKGISMAEIATAALPAVVLVHGGFVDGSGWEDVYKILRKDGYRVSIVQNPTLSLADDVAATKRIVAREKGPVVLVGHSYGGVVITEAGNDPRVAGLVYIAAFAPDKGESVAALIK